MATITTYEIVEEMLANNGIYPGDPQVSSIWEYVHSVTGKTLWAIFYDEAHNDLDRSPFVENPRCLWNRSFGRIASPDLSKITKKTKVLILVRLDEAIWELERFKGFFTFESRFQIRLEELKELRDLLSEKETLSEFIDILESEGLFYELTETSPPLPVPSSNHKTLETPDKKVDSKSIYVNLHSVLCPDCFTEVTCIIGSGTYLTAHCQTCSKEWAISVEVREIVR